MAFKHPISELYVHTVIKYYEHFTLLLSLDGQRYLGWGIAWLARPGDMQRLSSLSDTEYAELRLIIREYEAALESLWQPGHMNYAWLGNLFQEHGGHGHMHLVPRYQEEREFAGEKFVDQRWGRNFSPYEPFNTSPEVLIQIRDALRAKIPGSERD